MTATADSVIVSREPATAPATPSTTTSPSATCQPSFRSVRTRSTFRVLRHRCACPADSESRGSLYPTVRRCPSGAAQSSLLPLLDSNPGRFALLMRIGTSGLASLVYGRTARCRVGTRFRRLRNGSTPSVPFPDEELKGSVLKVRVIQTQDQCVVPIPAEFVSFLRLHGGASVELHATRDGFIVRALSAAVEAGETLAPPVSRAPFAPDVARVLSGSSLAGDCDQTERAPAATPTENPDVDSARARAMLDLVDRHIDVLRSVNE